MAEWLDNQALGKQIKRIRQQLDLSQAELATELGTPGGQGEVSKWELGRERPPEAKLEAIARLGGVGLSVFKRSNGTAAPDSHDTPLADALSADDRQEFEYIVAQFGETEGHRRFAGHVTALFRFEAARDYARERSSSEAVVEAIIEWGNNEIRREKNRG